MRVLVVQNYDNTDLGQVGTALAEAGAEIDFRRAHLGEFLPETADGHDAAIVLGGGQNALDDDEYPYFPKLLELLRDFERQDRAVLGICLGSQIIARAFGGSNQIGGASEFGWHGIELTESAKADAVLGAMPENLPDLPVARRHVLAAAAGAASGQHARCREPGLPDRPRHLRHPVPFRGRPAAAAPMERGVLGLYRRAPSRLAAAF